MSYVKSDIRMVYKSSIAKKLLRLGYQIVDVFPQRNLDGTTYCNRTAFAFMNADGLDERIKLFAYGQDNDTSKQ